MGNEIINDLVPLLKTYIDVSNKDRDNQLEIVHELKSAVSAIRDCNVSMKLQIKQLETHYEMFSSSCKDRKEDCGKKFSDITSSLKTIPSSELTEHRDKEMESLNKKLDALSTALNKMAIRVYSVMGAGAFILAFVKWVLPLILKFTA